MLGSTNQLGWHMYTIKLMVFGNFLFFSVIIFIFNLAVVGLPRD